jgi:hypothetical protein
MQLATCLCKEWLSANDISRRTELSTDKEGSLNPCWTIVCVIWWSYYDCVAQSTRNWRIKGKFYPPICFFVVETLKMVWIKFSILRICWMLWSWFIFLFPVVLIEFPFYMKTLSNFINILKIVPQNIYTQLRFVTSNLNIFGIVNI